MVHIDAHCDTAGPYEGSKFHHGGPFRQAVLDGVLDPTRSSRSASGAGPNICGVLLRERHDGDPCGGVRRVGRGRHRQGPRGCGRRPNLCLVRRRQPRSGFAPGTGTPETGGLTPGGAALLRGWPASTSSAATSSRSRRNTTRPATPPRPARSAVRDPLARGHPPQARNAHPPARARGNEIQAPAAADATRTQVAAVTLRPIVPKGEALRRAVAWLAEQGAHFAAADRGGVPALRPGSRPTRSSCSRSFDRLRDPRTRSS